MMNVICYILPAIIASNILFKLGFKESMLSFILNSSFFIVSICVLNYCILIFGFDYTSAHIDFDSTSMIFVVKYLLLSLIWVVILPLIIWNLNRNVEIKIKERIILSKNSKEVPK